jgi:hypothetical protein
VQEDADTSFIEFWNVVGGGGQDGDRKQQELANVKIDLSWKTDKGKQVDDWSVLRN